jgi:hypothetical protein
MPGSERSLLITDAYRDRLARLAERASTLTLQRWQQNVTLNRLESAHALWVTSTVAALEQAQRAGVNLTLAYLSAFIASETGQRALEIPAYDASKVIGVADTGLPLAEPLAKTLIGVKSLIKDGKAPGEALIETGTARSGSPRPPSWPRRGPRCRTRSTRTLRSSAGVA